MDKSILCLLSATQRSEYLDELAALERPGLRFVWREDPEAVLDAVSELDPALLLVGMEIGMMEGLEFLALLMQQHPQLDKPVVVLPNKGDPFPPVIQRRDPQTGRSSTEEVDFEHIVALVDQLAGTVAPRPTGERDASCPADLFGDEPEEAKHLRPEEALPGDLELTPEPQPLPALPESLAASEPPPAVIVEDSLYVRDGDANDPEVESRSASPLPPSSPAPSGRPLPLLALLALLALGLVGGALYLMLPATPAPDPAADTAQEQPAAAASAPLARATLASEERPAAAKPGAPKGPPAAAAQDAAAKSSPAAVPEGPVQVSFTLGSASPTVDDPAHLQQLAQALRQSAASAELGGHTSDEGQESYNQRLSLRRANAIRHLLIQRGVDPRRLVVRAYGSSQPQASNDSEAGRAQNRRVTLRRLPER